MTGSQPASTVDAPAIGAFMARASRNQDQLRNSGIPTRRVEAWRYTPLRQISDVSWKSAPALDIETARSLLPGERLPEGGRKIVFGNGYIVPELSDITAKESFDQASIDPLEDRFSARLNAALEQEGLTLRVPQGVDGGVVSLVSLNHGTQTSTHLRHRIVLEEGASLTLFDLNMGDGAYLANPRFDVVLASRATLRHVKHQAESDKAVHLGIVAVSAAEHAEYDSFTLNDGSAIARHEVVADMTAPHAIVHVNGVQIVDGERLNDLTSMIRHAAPDCKSRQTVKTVLLDKGQGVFQGKIFVDRVAQKTDGYQMNQALLLSEKAQMNSKPELEIYADDVRCSHGATVGALDDEQLFYLRSRGVPQAQARNLLVSAFLTEALDLVTDDGLRNLLLDQVSV